VKQNNIGKISLQTLPSVWCKREFSEKLEELGYVCVGFTV